MAAGGVEHVSRSAAGLVAAGLWFERARAQLESAGARRELAARGCVVGYGYADAIVNGSSMSLCENTCSK